MSDNELERPARLIAAFSLSVFSVLITFGLLETAARIYLWHFATDGQFKKYASFQQLSERKADAQPNFLAHRYLGYTPAPHYRKGKTSHNSLGFRGEEIQKSKPRGEFRIVCIGGSTTYGFGIEDDRLTYPALLQKELSTRGFPQVKVINAGVNAYTSWESLINFQFRILDLDPDVVIVYDAFNDIHARLVWPPNAYLPDNSGRRRVVTEVGMVSPSLFEHSTLLRGLLVRGGLIPSHSAFEWTIDRPPDTYRGESFRIQKQAGTYPTGIFSEVSAAQMFEMNLPTYFEHNIEILTVVAKYKGIHVVIATFAYSPSFSDQPFVSSPEYQKELARMNESLRLVARRTDADLVDLAIQFVPTKENFIDGVHVSPQGAALQARLLADFLIIRGRIR
jgi:lysophospholipase L1-like esterase